MVGSARARALPDVPTFAEAGYRDNAYSLVGPVTLLAPATTPDAIIQRLGREVSALVKSQPVSQRIEDMGAEPVGNLPGESRAAYKTYLPVVLKLTADTGVTLD